MDIRKIKEQIDNITTPSVIAILMQDLGYKEAIENKNFRMREERSASASISKNCKISDFGDDFTGKSIFDLIMRDRGVDFVGSVKWVAGQLGLDTQTELPKKFYEASQKKVTIVDEEKKYKTFKWVQSNNFKNKEMFGEQLYQDFLGLFSFASYQDFTKIYHLLGFSNYQKDDTSYHSLTIELPLASAIRKGIFRGQETKWITNGQKTYIHQNIKNDAYIYIHSGMSEILMSEIMGLSYIGVQADSISIDGLDKFEGRTVVVLEENDLSSQKFSEKCVKHFDNVKIIKLGELSKNEAQKGFDFRDWANEVGSWDMLKILLEHTANLAKYEDKPVGEEIVIEYEGRYIPKINIDKGVVVARTGSGKTYQFQNKPFHLILVPRVLQSDVGQGEGTEFLINKIFDSGAVITFDKFYGHYVKVDYFKKMIDERKIKLVVDEAHILVGQPSKKHKLIYELDALFLSGTLEKSFRSDLQRYKYKPKQPTTLYYTNGIIPKIKGSLIFADIAKALMQNYPNASVVSKSQDDNFVSVDVHSTSEPYVFSTSALREGISIHNQNFKTSIVVKKFCKIWSVKDTIQALHRVRGENTKIVTEKPKEQYKGFVGFEWWKDFIKKQSNTKMVNAILGEYYSKLINITHKTNEYIEPSDYGIACYLAHKTRDNYDTDFYKFGEYKGIDEVLEIDSEYEKEDRNEDETTFTYITKKGEVWEVSLEEEKKFNKWIQQYESGLVHKIYKFQELKSFKEIYLKSNISRQIRASFNKMYKGERKYNIGMFYTLFCSLVVVEKYNQNMVKIERCKSLDDLWVKVVGICPIKNAKIKEILQPKNG